MSLNSNNNKLLAVTLATACSGLCAGALSFVSFVDVRSFLQHLTNKKTDVVVSHFQVWWPNGRDFMVPLLACNMMAHSVTYFFTKDSLWIATGTLIGLIGPYTAIVLGEDIEALRSSSEKEVDSTARRFCTLHHVRLVMAATGFGMSLFGMGKQFEKNAR